MQSLDGEDEKPPLPPRSASTSTPPGPETATERYKVNIRVHFVSSSQEYVYVHRSTHKQTPPPTCTHRKDVGSLWVNVFTSHLSSAPKNSKQRDLWYQTHPQFHHFCHVNRNIYSNTILYTYCMYWKGLSHFEAPLCRHNEGKPHPVESNLGHRRCKALMKWWVFSLCLYWYQC